MSTVDAAARSALVALVLEALVELIAEQGREAPAELDQETRLLGKNAALDSLGLVTLIVELESRIEARYDVVLTLADERAMSQQRSPFRSVGALADYIGALLNE
jgi:acyl carrier protein